MVDEKGAAWHTTSQSSSGSSFWSLRLQMCPASVDLVLSAGLLKFALCPPYLCLKVLAVRPTYFSSVLLTVALYTRLLIVHFPGRGHLDLSWQLQTGGGLGFSWFKILKLCLAISDLRFGKQGFEYEYLPARIIYHISNCMV